MKLGPILGALSPGLSATGMFGSGAQGTGQGMLMGMSPLLAMLLHKHHQQNGGDGAGGGIAPPSPAPAPPGIATPATTQGSIQAPVANGDPSRRKQIGLALMQFGQNMGGSPFGYRSY